MGIYKNLFLCLTSSLISLHRNFTGAGNERKRKAFTEALVSFTRTVSCEENVGRNIAFDQVSKDLNEVLYHFYPLVFWIEVHHPFNTVFVSETTKIGAPGRITDMPFYLPAC